MKFDSYDNFARILPAFISVLPIIILYFLFLESEYGELIARLGAVKWIGALTFGSAFAYLSANVSRLIGKAIESKLYADGLYLPTTNLLTDKNQQLSPSYKLRLRARIKAEFAVDLSGSATSDIGDRRRINEAVGFIRSKFRTNPMVLQRNMQFGFVKNLIGGSLSVGLPASMVVLAFALSTGSQAELWLSVFLLVVYALPVLSMRYLMDFSGDQYARTLYEEYLVR